MEELEKWFHNTERTGHAEYCPASEGYFRVLGIPLLQGRLFDDRDTLEAPHVAVISESLAREKWPGQERDRANDLSMATWMAICAH